jgi:NADH-quinone oxidoreductase subunit J
MGWVLNLVSSYYIFYLALMLSALQVIVLNNPIYSVLYLILVFIISSMLFIISGVQFLGLVLMIVYLGAVVVLFLFVVMLLNIKILELRRGINFYPFLLICLINTILILVFLKRDLSFLVNMSFFTTIYFNDWSYFFLGTGSFKAVAKVLYTIYFLHFIIASLILFVAMVGAILLTLSQLKTLKKPDYIHQILRSRGTILISEF